MSHRSVFLGFVVALAASAFVAFAAQGGAGRGQGQGAGAPPATPGGGGQGQGGGRGRGGPITLHAARVLDGKGGVVQNAVITVQGSKIVSVGPMAAGQTPTYELGDATLMPGMIDVHVHLQWIFGPNGNYNNYPNQRDMTKAYQNDAVLENARMTLMAGFTTVQSPGWNEDKPLNTAIQAGVVNGPRIVTSLQPVSGGTPDAIRASVRQHKADGADFIKFFASGSIRQGGKMSTTQEQLDAVCGEAKAQGLRTLIHAHDPESIIASVKAGCTEIEHGVFADDAAIKAMKDANVWFDPNIGLVLQNYLEHHDEYLDSSIPPEGFAFMERCAAARHNRLQESARRRPQDADGNGRCRRCARPERPRDRRAGEGGTDADGRDYRDDVALGGVAQPRGHDWHARAGLRGRHRRGAWGSDQGHLGRHAGAVRDEGRAGHEEELTIDDRGLTIDWLIDDSQIED